MLDPQPVPTGAQWGEHGSWQWQEHTCHWRVLGNKRHPALVLIHGFGAASGHWRHNAAELAAAGWCVYAIDLVGFGASSQPSHHRHQPLDNRLWARQLQGFLEQVVQGPAVLVGNSLGSLVALTCAVFFPVWVSGVVAAPLPDPTLLMPLQRRRRPWRRQLKRQVVVVLCRLLPLELLVPLIARTPLLDLGLRSPYGHPTSVDRELRRLVARPALRPDNPRVLQLAGAVEFEKRSYLLAETHLARALQKAPEQETSRRLLALTYLQLSQPAKTLATLQPLLDKPDPGAAVYTMAAQAHLQAGDLVIFATESPSRPSHAGIYVGEGRFVHAPRTGGVVRMDFLSASYWQRSYLYAKRPLAAYGY